MIQLRQTGNPLDRGTRNDINYNWQQIETLLEKTSSTTTKVDEAVDKIVADTAKLSREVRDAKVDVAEIKGVVEVLDLQTLSKIVKNAQNQGNTAESKGERAERQGKKSEQQGVTSEEQGLKAQAQGNKAQEQGEYAKAQGDYARDKAQDAASITEQMEEAHKDLPTLKAESIEATQRANLAKQQADEATEATKKATENSIVATKEAVESTNKANEATIGLEVLKTSTENVREKTEKLYGEMDKLQTDASKTLKDSKATLKKSTEINTTLATLKTETETVKDNAVKAFEDATQAAQSANKAASTVDGKIKDYDAYIADFDYLQEYNRGDIYRKNNMVSHEGSTFIALKEVPKGVEPSLDKSEYWRVVARKGVDGEGAVSTVNGLSPDDEGNVEVKTATDLLVKNTRLDMLAARNIVYSDTAPDNPQAGDIWVDTTFLD